jgi:hypothetical protein
LIDSCTKWIGLAHNLAREDVATAIAATIRTIKATI